MPRRDDLLHLLLARAGDRAPALRDGLPLAAATAPGSAEPWHANTPAPRKPPEAEHGPSDGQSPEDFLVPQAPPPKPIWGIVAPEGQEGDRLMRLVDPLIRAREAEQDSPAPIYRVPKTDRPWTMADAIAWRTERYDGGAGLGRNRATVQLVLGDFTDVPFAVQQLQSMDADVGRLVFDDDDGYASYVAKVLRAERGPRRGAARVVLHTAHDGSPALDCGMNGLAMPGEATLRAEAEIDPNAILSYAERGATGMDKLLERAADPSLGVLFTLSHGIGAPREGWQSQQAQRADQGAMSFGFEGQLSGRDLASVPFMPGGLWLMFACFGAGTPDSSAYASWLTRMEQFGRHGPDVRRSLAMGAPFVADLPKRVLANPNGPLGFVGHVDLAWTFSFRDDDKPEQSRAGRFMRVLSAALSGRTLGAAFHELGRFVIEADARLTSAYLDEPPIDAGTRSAAELRRALLWMTRQDLAGFILLGDPSARLPVGARLAPPAPPPIRGLVSVMDGAAPEDPLPPAPAPMDIDRIERAIGAVMAGIGSVDEIATQSGMSPDTLGQQVDTYRRAGRGALGFGG